MKTVIILVLLTGLVMAGNPDERISLEFDFTKHFMKYDRSFSIADSSFSERDTGGPLNMDIKLIVPTRESVSLIFAIGYIKEKMNLFEIENKKHGIYLNFGVKVYLPGK